MMNLGDVAAKSVPKMTLVAPPQAGGAILTRTFIPHRCHKTIGVLGAVTVATACLVPGSVDGLQRVSPGPRRGALRRRFPVEHPTGEMTVIAHRSRRSGRHREGCADAEVLRTARKLMDGRPISVVR
jgi:4-oxalomesaconate tautomerase